MRLHALLIPAAVLVLAACGGGGGSASAAPGPPSVQLDLGNRAVPGCSIQVRQAAVAVAGQPVIFVAAITPEPGLAPPAQVEAAVSMDEPAAWMPIAQAVDGTWTWTVTAPADLADQRVWLRITDSDGNIGQSGGDDFRLAP